MTATDTDPSDTADPTDSPAATATADPADSPATPAPPATPASLATPASPDLADSPANPASPGGVVAGPGDVLVDTGYRVGLPAGAPPWQVAMARFTDGPDHAGRRAAVVARLADLPAPDRLAAAAQARTEAWLAVRSSRADGMVLARRVPVAVLAEGLGVAGDGVEEVVNRIATVVTSVAPRSGPTPVGPLAAATAVRTLDALLPGGTAALSILFQAHDATAALIGNALVTGLPVDDVLRGAPPPVVSTRRVGPDGGPVVVDLTGQPFGAGPHACPGRDQAVALATGVLAGIRAAGWAPVPGPVTYEDRPNLRLPNRVGLSPRPGRRSRRAPPSVRWGG